MQPFQCFGLIYIFEYILYFVDHCQLYPWGITFQLQLKAGGFEILNS